MSKKKSPAKGKSAPKPAKAKTHTVSEDGMTVTRHHAEGDSVQVFNDQAAAKDYAASLK